MAMGDDDEPSPTADGDPKSSEPPEEPLDPSAIAQFVEHHHCPRYIKQQVAPGDEPDDRDWREAFGLMNITLLGNGKEFEARQIEALATEATKIIGPELEDPDNTDTPDISIDDTWADSPEERRQQLLEALEDAADLSPTDDQTPYILCYQAPLGGHLGAFDVWGEVDCLVLSPAESMATETNRTAGQDTANTLSESNTEQLETTVGEGVGECQASVPAKQTHTEDTDAEVNARILDIKSASEQQPSHHVQVAVYSALFDQFLSSVPTPQCGIETSVLTHETAARPGQSLHPLSLPTFPHEGWQLTVKQTLAADGKIDTALSEDLDELPFAVDYVCDNCAYKEACVTRAVEDPTATSSLALLGFNPTTQQKLQHAGISSLRELSELLPRQEGYRPTDESPTVNLQPSQQRALEQALPEPIHETVQRAQALRGKLDPNYDEFHSPPVIPGKDWIPLPDDRFDGWSNICDADKGELIHVALFVRPDTAINRIGTLGACIHAKNYDEYITIGDVIDAVPDNPELATTVESELLERYLDQVFEAIETVASEVGDSKESVIHCYTFTPQEAEALAEALERHSDTLEKARAMRALCSLHEDGSSDIDQSMLSPVQKILSDQFALAYPSEGLLSVAEQFVQGWSIDIIDPPGERDTDPPLRAIFREQFLANRVPYVQDNPGISLNHAPGSVGEQTAGPAKHASSPAGFYPVRKRAGAQFPLEYIWAVTPKEPTDNSPRLRPEIVNEWTLDDETKQHYKQEIGKFYYRTNNKSQQLQRSDVEYLAERISYTLMRVIKDIPYKNAYHPKEPLDVRRLSEFELPVSRLPEAARDYLRIEFGTQQTNILEHYKQPLRQRARSGHSIPVRCTEITIEDDGSLTISGELAYEVLFEDQATAAEVAQQARLRSNDGPGSGSWRLLTRFQSVPDKPQNTDTAGTNETSAAPTHATDTDGATTAVDTDVSAAASGHSSMDSAGTAQRNPNAALTVDDSAAIKHSPPVLVEDIDTRSGEISLTTFPIRFQRYGSNYRLNHCGWQSPDATNVDNLQETPSERDPYIADREPVQIEAGEVYMLDPMVDDFGAGKADTALKPNNIAQNALWQQLQIVRQTGQLPRSGIASTDGVEEFIDRLAATDNYFKPNSDQQSFIRAVDRSIVPLQGPPGTGKTSGAITPALLARVYANATNDESLAGIVTAPSHEAVDTVLESVVSCLDSWQQEAETDDFADLTLLRVLPSAPPSEPERPDSDVDSVDVTYANYHNAAGEGDIKQVARQVWNASSESSQCLLFATPATLYQSLKLVAECHSGIDGDSAPKAMRHDGLFDIVCCDEASMLPIPQLLLAGSVLKPAGQTLLVGDHRQLPTVTETDWEDSLRRPLTETKAYLSALDYIRWLNETGSGRSVTTASVTNTNTPPKSTRNNGDQTQLLDFGLDETDASTGSGGDNQ